MPVDLREMAGRDPFTAMDPVKRRRGNERLLHALFPERFPAPADEADVSAPADRSGERQRIFGQGRDQA